MSLDIEVVRIGKCVSCMKAFKENEQMTLVRIKDDDGYSIAYMCNDCIDACLEHKSKRDMLYGKI